MHRRGVARIRSRTGCAAPRECESDMIAPTIVATKPASNTNMEKP